MKLAAVLLSLLILSGASQPLAAQTSQQDSTQEIRGTEQSPIVVKVTPPNKSKDDLAREDAKHAERVAIDNATISLTADLVRYTKLLFVATAILALITFGLVIVGFKQSRDTKESITAATASSLAAERAATAGERQAEIATQTMIASQRPWLAVKHEIDGPVEWKENMGAYINLKMTIRNTGPTPALNVAYQHQIRPAWGNFPQTPDLYEMSKRMRTYPDMGIMTLFPGDEISRNFTLILVMEDVEIADKAWRAGRTDRHFAHLSANIDAIIQYKFPFTNDTHQTAMRLYFYQHRGHLMDYAGYTGRPLGLIPVVNLGLSEFPGGFAD